MKIIDKCRHSYGSDGIMTDCSKLLDPCKKGCKGFDARAIPKNEDERALQAMEWE